MGVAGQGGQRAGGGGVGVMHGYAADDIGALCTAQSNTKSGESLKLSVHQR